MPRVFDHRPASSIGSCPNCGESIPVGYELISYQTSEGRHRRFAECPACSDVVHPG